MDIMTKKTPQPLSCSPVLSTRKKKQKKHVPKAHPFLRDQKFWTQGSVHEDIVIADSPHNEPRKTRWEFQDFWRHLSHSLKPTCLPEKFQGDWKMTSPYVSFLDSDSLCSGDFAVSFREDGDNWAGFLFPEWWLGSLNGKSSQIVLG